MGITIEIVTSIILILSCGLALDYAAHIGVAYMCSRETTRDSEFGVCCDKLSNLYKLYKVSTEVVDLSWVNLEVGSFPSWLTISVATHCMRRMVN